MCPPKCPATGKSSYRSHGDALEWVNRPPRARRGYRRPHRAYLCPFCHYWHTTCKPLRTDTINRKRRVWKRRLTERRDQR